MAGRQRCPKSLSLDIDGPIYLPFGTIEARTKNIEKERQFPSTSRARQLPKHMTTSEKWGAHGFEDALRWPRLPSGTMAAGDPIPPHDERQLLIALRDIAFARWTRYERRRMRQLERKIAQL